MRSPRGVLILLQNRALCDDLRVEQEALALTGAGYKVCVICPKKEGQENTVNLGGNNEIQVYSYPALTQSDGMLSYALEYLYSGVSMFVLSLKALRKPGFDVIHACNPPDIFFIVGKIYRLLGKKFVFDQHDLSPELYLSRFSRPRKFVYRALLFLEKLTYKTADAVIATNTSYKEIAVSRGRVSPERVFVVRNGPLEVPDDVDPDMSAKKGHRFLVYYMGEISPQDGVDCLVRIANYIIKKGRTDIYFLVTGDGASLNDVKKMAHDLGLDEHVGFTGWISDRKLLYKLLSTADVCIAPEPKNPLNDHSTFVKVMDYMAAGKPVVAHDLKETRITAQDAALYARPNDVVDFAEKIEELLGDECRRVEMGEFGRQRIKEALSWKYARVALINAYETLF